MRASIGPKRSRDSSHATSKEAYDHANIARREKNPRVEEAPTVSLKGRPPSKKNTYIQRCRLSHLMNTLKPTAKTEQLPTTLHDTEVCNLKKNTHTTITCVTCVCVCAFFPGLFFPRIIVLAMEEVKTRKVLNLQKSAGFIQLNRSCIIGHHLGTP